MTKNSKLPTLGPDDLLLRDSNLLSKAHEMSKILEGYWKKDLFLPAPPNFVERFGSIALTQSKRSINLMFNLIWGNKGSKGR